MTRGLAFVTAIVMGLGLWAAPAQAWPVLLPPTEAHPSITDGDTAPRQAVVPHWRPQLDPENAVFVLEEASAAFLGTHGGDSAKVWITIDAADYEDLFTVFFPRGSARLSLAAEDMTAMAAEAARGLEGVDIWISGDTSAGDGLALERLARLKQILMQNDVPADAIHLDDGSLEAILNRPARLRTDPEA